ncbi:protein of unknown function [Pseudomonas sp. JV551A1]|uniref:Uncharacterized protein n=1 Tax=Pseudomonas inefficax TaxID=2078786 RepID=A0AAQ1PAB7_9PSED|nr:protein of unknown function [Pseudomonas sp. JV551A1]SPO61442.1 protein of unknown function [Pseudomonas inefficax]
MMYAAGAMHRTGFFAGTPAPTRYADRLHTELSLWGRVHPRREWHRHCIFQPDRPRTASHDTQHHPCAPA